MLEHPIAADVFSGVGLAFEAQARDAFEKIKNAVRVGAVRVVPSRGAAVSWHPKTAATETRGRSTFDMTLHLPAVDPGAIMTRREASLFAGYAVHELGHVLFTNLDAFSGYARGGAIHKHIINGLEDPRMERALIASRLIPGAKALLFTLADFILEKGDEGYRAAVAADQLCAVPVTLALFCREFPLAGLPALRKVLPARMAEAVRIGVDAVRSAKKTGDLIPACDAILKLYGTQATEPEPALPIAPEAGAGSGSDAGGRGKGEKEKEAGEGAGAGAGSGAGSDENDEGDEKSSGDDNSSGDGDGDGDGAAADADGDGDADIDPDAADADADAGGGGGGGAGGRQKSEEELQEEAAEKIAGDAALDPEPARAAESIADRISGDQRGSFEGEMRAAMEPVDWKRHGNANKAEADAFSIRARASCKATPLSQAKLSRALRSPRVSWALRKLLTGRIDPVRLPRTAVGDGTVFIRRGETEATETALTLLVDASGSMGGECSRLAGAAAYSLAHLFSTMRLPVEVASFTTGGETGCDIRIAKLRDETIAKATPAITSMAGSAHGGTPDAEAIGAYVRKMRSWTEAKRVMIVITDGVGSAADKVMQDVLKRAEGYGVQVFALGIRVNPASLERRYPGRNVNVSNVREVPQALADLLLKAADEWDKKREKAI